MMTESSKMQAIQAYLCPRLKVLGGLSAIGLVLPWAPWELARSVPGLGWLLDLAVHWQWHYAAVAGVAFLGLGLLGRTRAARVWLAGVALCGLPLLSASPALAPAQQPGSAALRVASLNLNLDNTSFDRILDWVDDKRPDVLVLQEMTPDMSELMVGLRKRFPFYSESARPGAFGSAVYSMHPLDKVAQEEGAQGAVTYFELQWDGLAVPVAAVHPYPPLAPANWLGRDALLQRVAQRMGERAPSVVLGDFNASPWSSGLQAMQEEGFSRGTRLTPTHSLWGGLTIDHVLARDTQWRVAAAGVGPDVGSDHRPIWTDLSPKAP